MKKDFLKYVSAIVSVSLLISLTVGCSSNSIAESNSNTNNLKPEQSVKISWLSNDNGRVLKKGDPIIAEFEKKTNIKIDFQLINGANLKNKVNVLLASNSLPDITRLDDAYDIFQYAQQGAFQEVNELVNKYGTNIKKQRSQELWDAISFEGKYYGIPNTNTLGKYNLFIRQDWLENLNIKMPTNTDELFDVFKQFATSDPDKDGQANTIAFGSEGAGVNEPPFNAFMHIFGAFGMQPDQYYINGNKVIDTSVSSEFKEAIIYIKKLYDDNLIDPELFVAKSEQAKQKILEGKTGAFVGWWSIGPQVLMDQLKMDDLVPGVKWGIVKELKGPNGKSGIASLNKVTSINCIAKNSNNAEACIKAIDYLLSDEGALLATVGIKDVHWIADANGKFEKYTDAGNKLSAEKVMGLLSQQVLIPSLGDYVNKKLCTKYAESIDNAATSKMYSSSFEGLSTSDKITYCNDLKKLETDWFIKFVMGKEPISKWDEYVKQYNDKGGKAVLNSLIKDYNTLKGTNLIAAY